MNDGVSTAFIDTWATTWSTVAGEDQGSHCDLLIRALILGLAKPHEDFELGGNKIVNVRSISG